MKKKEFINELKKIFEKPIININDSLDKYDYDSLKVLELIVLKETKFAKLLIKPNDFNKCKKINDLLKLFKIKN